MTLFVLAQLIYKAENWPTAIAHCLDPLTPLPDERDCHMYTLGRPRASEDAGLSVDVAERVTGGFLIWRALIDADQSSGSWDFQTRVARAVNVSEGRRRWRVLKYSALPPPIRPPVDR